MKFKTIHLLTVIFILFAFIRCTDSVTSNLPTDENSDLKQPNLETPKNSSDQSTAVSFDWEAVESAGSYQIQLSADASFSDILLDSVTTEPGFDVQGLPYSSDIYWKVRTVDDEQTGPWSSSWQFKTKPKPDNARPITTKLISPTNNSEEPVNTVMLQWTTVASATGYKVHISADQNFSSKTVAKEITSSSYQPTNLEPQKTYYWRVEPIVSNQETEWSKVREFATTEETQQTISIVSPSDGASDLSTKPTFEWEPVENADYYILHVNRINPGEMVIETEVDGNTYTPENDLDTGTTHDWRVRAVTNGIEGEWTEIYSFTTGYESGGGDDGSDDGGSDNPSGSVEGDRQALMDLHSATNGNNWRNDSGWGDGNPSNSWHGVEVNSEGRVVRLDLSANGLTGNLPESIGNLTEVRYFNVKQNRISGQIPSSIGNMVSLRHLLLNGRGEDPRADNSHHPGKTGGGSWSGNRSNEFSGPIPASIGNLQNLRFFEAMGPGGTTIDDGTGYPGTLTNLPEEIGSLTNLEGLHLDFNNISTLPSSMSNLKNLVHLSISQNALKGHGLPAWIGQLTNLEYIWIGRNNMQGSFPDLSNLRKLQIFSSFKNYFEGSFPKYMIDGTMPDINMLGLAWNEFTGSLPAIGENNLAQFSVGWNNMSGSLPSLSRLHSVKTLGLDHNNFEGEIPDLTNSHSLRYLRANGNNFTGTLPMVDTSNERLQFIHVQNNRMSGRVPSGLSDLANLPIFRELDVSNNNFSSSDLDPIRGALGGMLKE